MAGFQPGLLDNTRADGWVCITSIRLLTKCLTTANIPLPPVNPIDVLAFVTPLEKQSSSCLARVRDAHLAFAPAPNISLLWLAVWVIWWESADAENSFQKCLFRRDAPCTQTHTQTNPPLCPVAPGRSQWRCPLSQRQCETCLERVCLATVWWCCTAAPRCLFRGHLHQTLSLSLLWFLEMTGKRKFYLVYEFNTDIVKVKTIFIGQMLCQTAINILFKRILFK